MSRTLILMRHAKSSWDDFMQPDHARVLNVRGRISADAMGNWLTQNNYLPDELLCSTAERTRETYTRLGLPTSYTRYEDSLYHASPDVMLRVLQSATSDTVLMVGHNPGIAHFAELLAKSPAKHPRFSDYPTCATTVFHFDAASWSDTKFTHATVIDFAIPREVIAAQNRSA
ncbi:SixA phosphatase family protein [Shimia sagamensis]|uniref:Phosphohistidine phosphatase n=1 Tax=Shimia sagamensis TaxID=1566352 RepID=A0ABY1NVF6_9RHOB|nr:histidine phosphatase family protein [Shimia sagamensis]SMP19005.1 phosphohistidine phosphatase [Shimia sagamensis]